MEGATPHSLVIIDELGRGTSTYDGYGIACAISEHIINKLQSFCLFATHFHELSELSEQHSSAVNKHVDVFFDKEQDSLVMLYKIKEGTCPQSYGIQVAKLAKFPDKVVAAAKEKVDRLESVDKTTGTGMAKLPVEVLQAMRKIKQFSMTHGNDADFKEKLQAMIEAGCGGNDAINDICTRLSSRGRGTAQQMEIDP